MRRPEQYLCEVSVLLELVTSMGAVGAPQSTMYLLRTDDQHTVANRGVADLRAYCFGLPVKIPASIGGSNPRDPNNRMRMREQPPLVYANCSMYAGYNPRWTDGNSIIFHLDAGCCGPSDAIVGRPNGNVIGHSYATDKLIAIAIYCWRFSRNHARNFAQRISEESLATRIPMHDLRDLQIDSFLQNMSGHSAVL